MKDALPRFTLEEPPGKDAMVRIPIASLVLITAVVLMLSVPVGAAPELVKGTVGPGFTMSLTRGGKDVTRLKPGVYRFAITDKSAAHDFRLVGPGLNRLITSVPFQGTKSVTVTLRRGTYRYVCDLHGPYMAGAINVR